MSKNPDNKKSKKKLLEAHIVTLGDARVGKTSLIIRYIENSFVDSYLSTLGMDSRLKKIKLKNDEEIKVRITDSAGQERFKSLSANYIKKANGILLVYDITNKDSFNNINKWVKEIKEKSHSLEERPTVLIGNKLDLEEKRCISKEQGEELAKNFCGKIKFFETSCKTGENIEEAVNYLAEQIYNKLIGSNGGNNVNIKDIKGKEGGKCC